MRIVRIDNKEVEAASTRSIVEVVEVLQARAQESFYTLEDSFPIWVREEIEDYIVMHLAVADFLLREVEARNMLQMHMQTVCKGLGND